MTSLYFTPSEFLCQKVYNRSFSFRELVIAVAKTKIIMLVGPLKVTKTLSIDFIHQIMYKSPLVFNMRDIYFLFHFDLSSSVLCLKNIHLCTLGQNNNSKKVFYLITAVCIYKNNTNATSNTIHFGPIMQQCNFAM
jgi:hypothetical protein